MDPNNTDQYFTRYPNAHGQFHSKLALVRQCLKKKLLVISGQDLVTFLMSLLSVELTQRLIVGMVSEPIRDFPIH